AAALDRALAAARLPGLRARDRAGATEWDAHPMAMTDTTPDAATTSPPIIDVHGIGKAYPGVRRGHVWVLRDIRLALAPGTVLGLLGPNGAGKTTLIKILAGLLRPDTGGGTVLGYDLLREHPDIRARVSLVAPTADVGTDNNLTVRQNLTFWAPIYRLH